MTFQKNRFVTSQELRASAVSGQWSAVSRQRSAVSRGTGILPVSCPNSRLPRCAFRWRIKFATGRTAPDSRLPLYILTNQGVINDYLLNLWL
ncbi:MAG: hypothetical protein F6K63_30985 [Moorea sp. SIO1G6]|uniref:hypothetical protein n=1 Tax=Moorena sp. SIO1G6 TaxID=2607840 RepID=UPI0013C1912D|nr:hypothetical protein [Moorena sp. SIO1G6]NET68582.1 hypothetical protein [Moorena sp. SIO1G6]